MVVEDSENVLKEDVSSHFYCQFLFFPSFKPELFFDQWTFFQIEAVSLRPEVSLELDTIIVTDIGQAVVGRREARGQAIARLHTLSLL